VLVERYNPEWPRWFTQIQAVLYRNLAGTYHGIEHVGSTAVPGMTAKPIIDIDVVQREGMFPEIKQRLQALGYYHNGDQGVPEREVFKLADDSLRSVLPAHHLYVCPADSAELRRHLAFRDYLRANPLAMEQLSALKLAVASKVGDDRDAYQQGKAWLVEELLAAALHTARP
jgi:GrpB-like predicted nucleotidyltransferase (UPF0157 family)